MKNPIERIMVYVDGTEQSVAAAQFAICLAKFMGAQLIAAYVINARALNDLLRARIFLQEEETQYEEDLESDATRYLKHIEDLSRQKGVAVETITLKGAVHQEIVNAVREKAVDLLCIGELARIRSRRDELYDEAERAMRSVACSVMIVKNEDRVSSLFEELA